jgi:TRAP-type C4-dicarboxylate transport system substrate-binding protein
MNLAKWESLPADVKKIMEDNIGLEVSRKAGVVYDRTEESMKKQVLDYGVKVNELPPEDLAKWQAGGKKIREDWAKELEAKGIPGNAILEYGRTLLGIE